MFRRVLNPFRKKKERPVFIGTVGGPVPAPPPTRSPINLPTVNMDAGYNNGNGCYGYSDMGLDDYRALHYYGLDGLDNIDF